MIMIFTCWVVMIAHNFDVLKFWVQRKNTRLGTHKLCSSFKHNNYKWARYFLINRVVVRLAYCSMELVCVVLNFLTTCSCTIWTVVSWLLLGNSHYCLKLVNMWRAPQKITHCHISRCMMAWENDETFQLLSRWW
jgi:hypothetical protein